MKNGFLIKSAKCRNCHFQLSWTFDGRPRSLSPDPICVYDPEVFEPQNLKEDLFEKVSQLHDAHQERYSCAERSLTVSYTNCIYE